MWLPKIVTNVLIVFGSQLRRICNFLQYDNIFEMFEVVDVKASTHERKTKKKNIVDVSLLRVYFPQLLQCLKRN